MKQWLQGFLPTNVETVTEQRLEELISDYKRPVIVDFFANWCQHCHIFAPIYDQASRVS
jgi:thiol-disulfide isomerase/thioredoxin